MTAVPIFASATASEIALLPRPCVLAGRGDSPVQSTYPGVFVGVHSLLGVVALRGLLWPSACTDPRLPSFSVLPSGKSSATIEWERRARLNSLIGREAERF